MDIDYLELHVREIITILFSLLILTFQKVIKD